MKKTYEQSVQRRVLEWLFQAKAPITSITMASELQVNYHSVSGTLSAITRDPDLKDLFVVDKTQTPWTYSMPVKSMTVDDIEKTFRKSTKKGGIMKKVTRAERPSKLETEKDTILIEKITFPKGAALRLTGDIIVAGIDIFLDVVAEIVREEGGAK